MKLHCNSKTIKQQLTYQIVSLFMIEHVEFNRHFIRKKIDYKELTLPYIRTQNQVAYVITKDNFIIDFERNVCKLGIFDSNAQFEGDC